MVMVSAHRRESRVIFGLAKEHGPAARDVKAALQQLCIMQSQVCVLFVAFGV